MSNDNGTMCDELPHAGEWVRIAVVGCYSAMVCGEGVDVLVCDQIESMRDKGMEVFYAFCFR